MKTLKEALGGPDQRPTTLREALALIDGEVEKKGGLTGFAIRQAYKVVKAVSPQFLSGVVDILLDGFLDALEPY